MGYQDLPTQHVALESRPLHLSHPTSPHQVTFMAIATQLRRTTDVKRVNRRLHIHDKRKWGTSED
jgi:hypothetical protein